MKPTLFSKDKIITIHDIQNMIETYHAKTFSDGGNDGKHSGIIGQPLVKGDDIRHYIASYKTRYEQLIAKVLEIYQPALQLPAGKIENDRAIVNKKKLNDEIDRIKLEINNQQREMGNYDPSGLASRIRIANLLGAGLFIGEVALNTQAFQVTGENLLSSLILSASVSLAVSLGAHFAGRKYKDAKSKPEKIAIVAISAIGICIVSSVIASLRTIFLKKIGVDVNPIYFTVFNVVFFLIASFATWYLYPNKEEIEQNREHLDRYKKIKELTKQMKQNENELKEYTRESDEKIQVNLQGLIQPEYFIERIKIMYLETVNEFKRANRLSRKEIPDCFNQAIPPLEIPHVTIHGIVNKYKNHNNDENDNNNSPNYAA